MKNTDDVDYKLLFESAPGLYLILLPDLTIVAVSEAYRLATMTKREEIVGRKLFDVFPDNPDDPSADGVSTLRSSLNIVLQNKVAHTMSVQKYDIRRPDGTFEERYWSPLNKPVFNSQNELVYIIHRVEDVSEFVLSQKELERKEQLTAGLEKRIEEMGFEIVKRSKEVQNNLQELKESEEKFQKTFQASAAGIAITRMSDSTYLDVNNAFQEMTGRTKAELVGHTSVELGIVTNMKEREKVLRQIREKGSAKDFELEVLHKSGKTVHVLSSAEIILLRGEKYIINIIYDITARKLTEEQLETVNKELEAFCYSVSHDLRAPLRAVNGYAKMLEEDYEEVLNAEGKRLLNVVQYNAQKMGNLIDDLLAFSRLGKKELLKSKINMNELVEGALIDYSKSYVHNAEITTTELYPIHADYALMHQVFFNLISNAIKYSSKKEKPVVEIRSEKRENDVVYSIKDNGVGFDMKYAHKLFGVFQRLHKMEEFEGTGVGLAFIQRIINKHGGKIWAESKPNEGATFFFTLPLN